MVRLHSESQTFSPNKFENEEFVDAPSNRSSVRMENTEEGERIASLQHIGDTPEEVKERVIHCATASNKPGTLFSYRDDNNPYSYEPSLELYEDLTDTQKIQIVPAEVSAI